MKRTISYKGYIGSVEIDEEDHGFGGIILNIDNAHKIYGEKDYDKLVSSFHEAVESYINDTKSNNDESLSKYKGSFNVRVEPKVHRDAVVYAKQHDLSLNKVVEAAIREKIYSWKKWKKYCIFN